MASMEEYQVSRARGFGLSVAKLRYATAQMGLFALHDIPADTELTCPSPLSPPLPSHWLTAYFRTHRRLRLARLLHDASQSQ